MEKNDWMFENPSPITSPLISPFYTSSPSIYSPSFEAEGNSNQQVFFGPDFDVSVTQRLMTMAVSTRPAECFSKKVFIGGIPAGTTEGVLSLNFAKFGKHQIDWPKKTPYVNTPPEGYAFVVFEDESSVLKLLHVCTKADNKWVFCLQSGVHQIHAVEIKVWEMKNANFVGSVGWRKYKRFSVFVGGLPRTCSADFLAASLTDYFGPVAYCSIEQDKVTQYPKGAACVVFCSKESYIRAIAVHELLLRFPDGDRKVELKSFLSSNMPCEKCGMINGGTKFCSEMICLAYYCDNCWKSVHCQHRPGMASHVALRKAYGRKAV